MSRNHTAPRTRSTSTSRPRPYLTEWGQRPTPATSRPTPTPVAADHPLSHLSHEALGILVAQALGSDVGRIVDVFTIALAQINSPESPATPTRPLGRGERQPEHTLNGSGARAEMLSRDGGWDAATVAAMRQRLINIGAAVFETAENLDGSGRKVAG